MLAIGVGAATAAGAELLQMHPPRQAVVVVTAMRYEQGPSRIPEIPFAIVPPVLVTKS